MSHSIMKRLVEQRANAWEGMKAILDGAETEGRDLTVEEQTDWEARNDALNQMDGRITALRDAEARTADAEAAREQLEQRKAERREVGGDTGAELRDFLQGKSGRSFEVRAGRPMGTDEFRTLSKLSAGAGANTVKVSFYDRLVAHLIEVANLLAMGPTVLQTGTGEQIQVPKTTAHSTAVLTAEAATISASDPAFGQIPLDAYKYAILLQASNELINDTSVDLEGYLAMQAGRALGNGLGTHLLTGTGTNQPNGAVTAATLGVTGSAGVSGAFTADNLIDLFFSVIAPYRNSPSCGWLMKDSSLATARKMKDTTNQYLWQPSLQIGAPDVIMGKPVRTDPFIAAVALSAKSVLFGDFSQYFVRLVDGIRFEQSADFAFNADLVTYRAILRGDGDLIDTTGALKYFAGNAA